MMIRIHRKARIAMKVRIVRMVSFATVTRTNGLVLTKMNVD